MTPAAAATWLALALSIMLNAGLFIIWRRTNKTAGFLDETLERTQQANAELLKSLQKHKPRIPEPAQAWFDQQGGSP